MESKKNINQRELLDWLIDSGKLGQGITARYEFNVGTTSPKLIDLVFEGKDVIWLVEAKTSKDKLYEAIGQIQVYEDLFRLKCQPSKPIKSAIVCVESDLEIAYFCRNHGIAFFVYKACEEEEEKKEKKQGIMCGVCGSIMVEKNGNWICKTCEYFFGISSRVERCRCGSFYGAYPGIEDCVTQLIFTKDTIPKYWIKDICPKCRKRKVSYYGTIAELIKYEFEKREIIMTQLTNFCMLPKEFIEYCLCLLYTSPSPRD